jgi:hypothetical protein
MKKLILKLMFLFGVVLLFLTTVYIVPLKQYHDLSPIINKLKMHKKRQGAAKLFILGGSGSVVGLDTPEIERELKIKAYNLSFFAKLRIDFYFSRIKNYVRKGDIYLYVPEYGTLIDTAFNKYERFVNFYYDYRPNITYKNVFEYLTFARDIITAKIVGSFIKLSKLKLKGFFSEGFVFYEDYFNRHGDMTKLFNIVRPYKKLDGYHWKFYTIMLKEYIKRFNKIERYMKSKGAKLLIMFCAFPAKEYLYNKKIIDAYYDELKSKTNITIVGRPAYFTYDYKYFSNTVYHLTTEGKKLHTARFVSALKKVLKNRR